MRRAPVDRGVRVPAETSSGRSAQGPPQRLHDVGAPAPCSTSPLALLAPLHQPSSRQASPPQASLWPASASWQQSVPWSQHHLQQRRSSRLQQRCAKHATRHQTEPLAHRSRSKAPYRCAQEVAGRDSPAAPCAHHLRGSAQGIRRRQHQDGLSARQGGAGLMGGAQGSPTQVDSVHHRKEQRPAYQHHCHGRGSAQGARAPRRVQLAPLHAAPQSPLSRATPPHEPVRDSQGRHQL